MSHMPSKTTATPCAQGGICIPAIGPPDMSIESPPAFVVDPAGVAGMSMPA